MKIPILNIEIRKASKQEVSNIAAWSSGGRSLLLSRDKPMLLSTVYRCVDLISDSVAVLPLKPINWMKKVLRRSVNGIQLTMF